MILPFFMDVVAATKRIVFPLERKEKNITTEDAALPPAKPNKIK
jgi:hypothetical protein